MMNTEKHSKVLLSIIVPVYNAAMFLERCVDSLLAQGLHSGEYEIILVNDGSTDSSLAICSNYCSRFPDIIKVFSHENKGVAYTRNKGMEKAVGEYVCFVDADDYLIPGGFRYLADNHLDVSLDILSFSSITLDEKTKRNFIENNRVEGKVYYEMCGLELLRIARMSILIVNNWFKRSFLCMHHLSFTPGLVIAEDVLFCLHVYLKNPKIRKVSSCLYRYDMHTGSAIHRRDKKFIRKAIESYLILIREFSQQTQICKCSDPRLFQGLRCLLESQFIPFMSRVLSSDYSISEFCRMKKQLQNMNVLPLRNTGKMGTILRFIFSTPYLIRIYEWGYQCFFHSFHIAKTK
ncbi:MAG: glycosyltransferase [Bacteroidales bacterium]|nr:glycosyltransferase [Bacteroidales bacterium]